MRRRNVNIKSCVLPTPLGITGVMLLCFISCRAPLAASYDTEAIHAAKDQKGRRERALRQDRDNGALPTNDTAETAVYR